MAGDFEGGGGGGHSGNSGHSGAGDGASGVGDKRPGAGGAGRGAPATDETSAGPPDLDTDQEAAPGTPGKGPGPGDVAPVFCLDGTGGRRYCLEDHSGEPVVLVFYPADHSPVCTQQLRSYSEDLNEFERLGATVLCLSPQDVASHEAFSSAQSLRLPLLSDVDKSVGEAYGVLGPLGFYRRSVFVVDPDGVIRFARRSLSNLTYLPTERLVEALQDVTN